MKHMQRLSLALMACASVALATNATAEVIYLQPDGTGTLSKDGSVKLGTKRPRAESLRQVRSISVKQGICATDIASALGDEGIAVTGSHQSDAKLTVNVSTDGRLSDPDSVEDGNYSATLRGHQGTTLFRTSGSESGGDLYSLCEDIGDTIADRLKDRMG